MINIMVTAKVDPATPLDTVMTEYVNVLTSNNLTIPNNTPFTIEQDRQLNITAITIYFAKMNVPNNQRNNILDAWDAIVLAHGLEKEGIEVENI